MKLVKLCALAKTKAMSKFIDHTVEAYEEYFEISFFGLLNSIIDIPCSTAEGRTDQNCMAVDIKGEAFKSFHFAKIINE